METGFPAAPPRPRGFPRVRLGHRRGFLFLVRLAVAVEAVVLGGTRAPPRGCPVRPPFLGNGARHALRGGEPAWLGRPLLPRSSGSERV